MNLQEIIEFATLAHKGQTRKHSGVPYIVHPISVMNKLLKLGVFEEHILAAAICHDIKEDCPLDYHNLVDVANIEVDDIVYELTFTGGDKNKYLESFKDKSLEALLIKILDRVDNVEDFKVSTPGYTYKYKYKADCLIKIWDSREHEIEKRFGISLFWKVKEIWNNV